MKYRHDLRFVRMLALNGSLHCDKHGLLPDDEAEDVLRRAGLTAEAVQASGKPGLLDRMREWWSQRRGPHCEPMS